jgi:pseudouridine-5'-phosphate glycosidase/pseudouridine kinase
VFSYPFTLQRANSAFPHLNASTRTSHAGTTTPPAELVVIGAAAVDVIAQAGSSSSSNNSLISASTVAGTVQTLLGGVARNVAEAAHRTLLSLENSNISRRSLLVAPLTRDSFGTMIQRETEYMGMRSDGLLFPNMPEMLATTDTAECRSPVCNMLLSGSGNLIGGVADFTILDTLRSSEVGFAPHIGALGFHSHVLRTDHCYSRSTSSQVGRSGR